MSDSSPAETPTVRAPRARKPTSRKPAAPRRRKGARRKRSPGTLDRLLRDLARQASRAGTAIAGGAAEGATTAKAALGRARAAGRNAVRASLREWKKLDTPRKVEFVATLLSALAAASGTIAKKKKKRKLFR